MLILFSARLQPDSCFYNPACLKKAARAAHGEILRGCHLLPRGAALPTPLRHSSPDQGRTAPPFPFRFFSPDPGRAGRGTSAAKNLVSRLGTGGFYTVRPLRGRGLCKRCITPRQPWITADARPMDKLCITVGLLYTAYPRPAHRVTHGCLR